MGAIVVTQTKSTRTRFTPTGPRERSRMRAEKILEFVRARARIAENTVRLIVNRMSRRG